MNDSNFPPRLGESSDEVLRDLLDGAKSETMEPARASRVLASFESSRGQAGRRDAGRFTSGSKWPLFAKVFLASFAMLCVAGISLRSSRSVREMPARETPVAPPSLAPPAADPTSSENMTMRIEDLPPAPAPQASERHAAAPSKPAASSASSFREELALVEAARASLKAGDSHVCLRTLDQYDRRFAGGVFADEVIVLRVEALIARGEHARARKLGEAFLEKRPESPYEGRLRSLLAKSR